MKTTTTIFMKNLKLLTTTLFLLFLQYSNLYAQTPEYADWTLGVNSGTGSFTCSDGPDFNFAITNFNTVAIDNSETFDDAQQSFETTYGQADNAENINIRANTHSLSSGVATPLVNYAVMTIDFNKSTPTQGWAFCVLDIEVDQIQITALDANNNPVSNASITSWLKELFDANPGNNGITPPFWDPVNSAVVGSIDNDGIYNTITQVGGIDTEAAGAWFEPNISINQLTLTFSGILSRNRPSYHFYLASNCDASLPVDLLRFETRPTDNHTAKLSWTTASEINNSHFDVERSYDGRTFEVVGEVAGNGNSQHQIEYSYTDASVSKVQNTVYYRLKQVDFDGAFEYSDIRVVRFDAVGNNMQLVAYPNPMNDELNVMLSLPSGEKYQLQVTNLQGALVHQKNHVFSSGLHTLDLSQWNSGVYIVEVISDRGSEHIKVMKK